MCSILLLKGVMTGREKQCGYCGKYIRGRSDKKFCNEYCRNGFHNQRNAPENNLVRKIDRYLRNNRQILRNLLGNRVSAIVARRDMLVWGFSFDYFTQISKETGNGVYYYCYEYSYKEEPGGLICIECGGHAPYIHEEINQLLEDCFMF